MPKYNYICPICGKQYSETRLSTDPQWQEKCPLHWCDGILEEVEE